LLFQLVRRDFEHRFVGSAIGWVWSLIHPLVLLVSWTFVFQYVLRQEPPEGIDSYPLFLFAGMLPWILFSETLQRSAPSLLDQANLITKTVFPAEIVPVSVFLSNVVNHLMALTLMVAVMGLWKNRLSMFLVVLPFFILAIGLFVVGLAWIVSSLHVFLRDTAQVLSVVLTFWFWFTPVFVDDAHFPKRIHFLLTANPLYYVVRAYRSVLLYSTVSDPWQLVRDLAVAVAFGAVAFIAGGLFFRHMKRGFADVL